MRNTTLKALIAIAALAGLFAALRRLRRRKGKTMTDKLKAHLIRCEKAIQSAKPIIAKHSFPDDYRTVTVIGFISVLIEHQESVLLLVMHHKAGSASALVRPIVEGAFRGLWINLPATDEEVKKFNEKDKIDLEFGALAAALDTAYKACETFSRTSRRRLGSISTATLTAGCTRLDDVSISMRLQTTTLKMRFNLR